MNGIGDVCEDELGLSLIWIPVENNGCMFTVQDTEGRDVILEDLTDLVTFDLYIRLSEPFNLVVFDSGVTEDGTSNNAGISVVGGEFYEHLNGNNQNTEPTASAPCIEFDSHLFFGNATDLVGVSDDPNSFGETINVFAIFVPSTYPSVLNPVPQLSDGASYVRILRATIPATANVAGEVFLTIDTVSPPSEFAENLRLIPPLPTP